jgi:seryl-tRNA synthetase
VSLEPDRDGSTHEAVNVTGPTSHRSAPSSASSTHDRDFRRSIIEAGLLVESGIPGLFHRSFAFERIIRGLETLISDAGGDDERRQLFCSPVMARSTIALCGFLSSFPDLVGTLSSFEGNDSDLAMLRDRVAQGGDWSELLEGTDLAMCSAACQNVYPLLEGASIPPTGLMYEVQAQCFRHESSEDLARMLTFRQHEFVFVGTEHEVRERAQVVQGRFCDLLDNLELSYEIAAANDPFFGRMGRLLAQSQRQKSLKYEFVAPITSDEPHSMGSVNFHEDHFGASFGIALSGGDVAHSSCIGFGLERLALALLFHHGLREAAWPASIRHLLSLASTHTPSQRTGPAGD